MPSGACLHARPRVVEYIVNLGSYFEQLGDQLTRNVERQFPCLSIDELLPSCSNTLPVCLRLGGSCLAGATSSSGKIVLARRMLLAFVEKLGLDLQVVCNLHVLKIAFLS